MNAPRQTVQTGCKINLGLRITGVREDGYHTLDSLFWPLARPFDTLHFEERPEAGMAVCCAAPDIDPAHNTLTRAWTVFAQATGFAPGVRVTLEKGIPSGAGLGGGSADAAVVLRWLNARAPQPLEPATLHAVAARAGADVPFFLYNVPCRVRGTGDIITPCDAGPLRGLHLVLACPHAHVSTPWAYAAWDAANPHKIFPEDLTTSGGEAKDIDSCPARFANDFEAPVFAAYPALRDIKERLLRHGAAVAVMSGSGASLAGLFRSAPAAQKAASSLHGQNVRTYVSVL